MSSEYNKLPGMATEQVKSANGESLDCPTSGSQNCFKRKSSQSSMNSTNDSNTKKSFDNPESLVGRWWEVFWDPSGAENSSEDSNGIKKSMGECDDPKIAPVKMDVVSLQPQNPVVGLVTQNISSNTQNSASGQAYPHPAHSAFYPPKQTTQLIAQPCKTTKLQEKQLQSIELIYTEQKLGLSLTHTNKKVVVSKISPDAPNGHLIRAEDVIAAINGHPFPPLDSADLFKECIKALKTTPRPMAVTFHRWMKIPTMPPTVPAASAIAPPVANMTNNATSPRNIQNQQPIHALAPQSAAMGNIKSSKSSIDANTRNSSKPSIKLPHSLGPIQLPPGRTEIQQPLPQIGPGWTVHIIARKNMGKGTPRADRYIVSPSGKRFRSLTEVKKYYNDSGTGDDIDDIPLNKLPKQTIKRSSCDSHDNDWSGDNGVSDDDQSLLEEDAIDWYDAKILSYEDGEFVVRFLGDEEGVTYSMPLSPSIVRPSVRSWAKRSLALLRFNGGVGKVNEIESFLPPSTELPDDVVHFSKLKCKEGEDRCKINDCQKLMEYSKIAEKQLYLATRLTLAKDYEGEVEDDDDKSDDEEEDEVDSPGPFVKSYYVNHLSECLKVVREACAWMSEPAVNLLGNMFEIEINGNVLKLPKESIRNCLVSGANILQKLIMSDPSHDAAARLHPTEKKTSCKRNAKKKRRLEPDKDSNNSLFEGMTIGNIPVQSLLSKSVASDEALDTLLTGITQKSSAKLETNLIESTIRYFLFGLYNKVWKPTERWIEKSGHMINGTCGGFYTFEDVEAHNAAASMGNLQIVDLSSWTNALQAKLKSARDFEMDAWSAIKASVELNSGLSIADRDSCINNDPCLAALRRLKREASSSEQEVSTKDRPMRNFDPLGRQSVCRAPAQSQLNRKVIEDAIKIRLWVLDLKHAKNGRERASFLQNVVERYATLPQLPAPPFGFESGCLDVAANTKDSITLLAANAYSYNHIIGNFAFKLTNSMGADQNLIADVGQDVSIKSKHGVELALKELMKLPILSLVEEKLRIRSELINWNEEASKSMAEASSQKLPFQLIKDLFSKLADIINGKSGARVELCQYLKPDTSVESEVLAFAIEDEKITCPQTGPWVRREYEVGTRWKNDHDLIMKSLQAHGFSSGTSSALSKDVLPLVDFKRISILLAKYNESSFCFDQEFNALNLISQNCIQWSRNMKQTVATHSLSFDERCRKLTSDSSQRPKGIVIEPSQSIVDKWIDVLSWRLKLERGVQQFIGIISLQRYQNQTEYLKMDLMNLLRSSSLVNLMLEGQECLVIKNNVLPVVITNLRKEVLQILLSLKGGANPELISKESIMDVLDLEGDATLFSVRVLFWGLMVSCYFKHISNSNLPDREGSNESDNRSMHPAKLQDAKILLSFYPGGSKAAVDSCNQTNAILMQIVKSEESCLRVVIDGANTLQTKALNVLSRCSALLETECFSHTDELGRILIQMKNLLVAFRQQTPTAHLLQSTDVISRLERKAKALSWLVQAFPFPVLFNHSSGNIPPSSKDECIPLKSLQELRQTIPVRVGQQWKVTGDYFDNEVIRVGRNVVDLYTRADEWQSVVSTLIPVSSGTCNQNASVIELCTLNEIVKSSVLSQVAMPQLEKLQGMADAGNLLKKRVGELFRVDYHSTDVDKARFPTEKSLVGKSGDFVLYRITGSDSYCEISRALDELRETASNLPIHTPEKATYKLIKQSFEWIESVRESVVMDQSSSDPCDPMQLIIKSADASNILDNGKDIFFDVSEEVKETLRLLKVSYRLFPQKFAVVMMKGGFGNSLGGLLLRWAALIFESLKSDIEREQAWEERATQHLESYSEFESMGTLSSIGKVTAFKDGVKGLIAEAREELIVYDGEMVRALTLLQEKIRNSDQLKRQIDLERIDMEQENLRKAAAKYENSQNIVDDRYDILDSLMNKVSVDFSDESLLQHINADPDLLVVGEQTVRDKSRLFLQKSLLKGMTTLGIDPSRADVHGFTSLLAFDLENAVFEKFRNSNEYRDKIRSLRFNLSDAKNPMLCSRVLSGKIKITDLAVMSHESLASKEMKEIRKQVKQEAIKNVVISGGNNAQKSASVLTSELVKKVMVESNRPKEFSFKSNDGVPSTLLSDSEAPTISKKTKNEKVSSTASAPQALHMSLQHQPSLNETEKTMFFAQKSPIPYTAHSATVKMEEKVFDSPLKTSPSAAMLLPPPEETDRPSPLLSPSDHFNASDSSSPPTWTSSHSNSHGYHITSQYGDDLFSITISRLKISFSTKMFIEQSCKWDLNGFLPYSLVEKGRIRLEEFNKFVSEKMKSGRWNLVHLKLSCITGDSNMRSYKQFYKEYESLDRICMISVSEDTKVSLVTPKFLRISKCMENVKNLSRTSTYAVLLTKKQLPLKYQGIPTIANQNMH